MPRPKLAGRTESVGGINESIQIVEPFLAPFWQNACAPTDEAAHSLAIISTISSHLFYCRHTPSRFRFKQVSGRRKGCEVHNRMPRYFFYLREGTAEIRDDEGQEFASLDDAEAHAGRVAAEVISITQRQYAGASLVVVDAQGKDVFEIPLSGGPSLRPKKPSPML